MKRRRALAALVGVLATSSMAADSGCAVASAEFADAVASYQKNGRTAFIERFLRGGPLADKLAVEGAQHLLTVERTLGPFQNGSVLSAKRLGERACYVVAVLEYESGPAFLSSMYYSSKSGAVPLSLRVEAEPEKVFSTPALISD